MVVLVQHPPDLYTACVLALFQEKVADGVFGSLPRPPEMTPRAATPLPLPAPPNRPTVPTTAMDHRGTDAARANFAKLKTMHDYRRA